MKIPKYFLGVALLVVVLDQVSKSIVVNSFPYTTNTGAAFGMLQSYQPFLIGITIIVIGLLFYYAKEYPIALGFILGGAVGNLIDRLARGFVIDFIDFGFWPSFNIADSANTIGAGLLIIYLLKEHHK